MSDIFIEIQRNNHSTNLRKENSSAFYSFQCGTNVYVVDPVAWKRTLYIDLVTKTNALHCIVLNVRELLYYCLLCLRIT